MLLALWLALLVAVAVLGGCSLLLAPTTTDRVVPADAGRRAIFLALAEEHPNMRPSELVEAWASIR